MGCDISVFLEMDEGDGTPFSSPGAIGIGSGECLPVNRNYDLFAALADVRNYGSIVNTVKPRGIPHNLSWEHIPYFFSPITEEMDHLPSQLYYAWGRDTSYSRSEAERYVNRGASAYNQPLANQQVKAGQLMTQLDTHTFGWLFLEEIKSAIAINNLAITDDNFHILLGIMELIEGRKGPGRTRMLFYFNN